MVAVVAVAVVVVAVMIMTMAVAVHYPMSHVWGQGSGRNTTTRIAVRCIRRQIRTGVGLSLRNPMSLHLLWKVCIATCRIGIG